jgi:PKHD-type hydroxylase
MPFVLPQPVRPEVAPYVFFKDFLTKEECEKLISLSKNLSPEIARIGGDTPGGAVVPEKRKTELYWIHWRADVTWLFERMANAVYNANVKWWGYHLAGFNEAMQLTHYRGDDKGFYGWHEDHGDQAGFSHRKLSSVILLNDQFEGGNFELFHHGKPNELTVGSMILFPSFRVHRVTEVIKGDRWSLVSWVSGPPFV